MTTYRRAVLKVSAALVDELICADLKKAAPRFKCVPTGGADCDWTRLSGDNFHRLLKLPDSCKALRVSEHLFFRENALALIVEDETAFRDVPEGAALPLVGAGYFRGPDGLAVWAGWMCLYPPSKPNHWALRDEYRWRGIADQEARPPEVALRWGRTTPLPEVLANVTDEEVAKVQRRFEEKFCGPASADVVRECRPLADAGRHPFDTRPESERWRDG